jgi:hypothetical protein
LLQKADDEENNVVSESAKKKEHMGTSMPEDHHSYIGNTLFEKGDRQSIADRCLFALNWTCIGKYHGMLFFLNCRFNPWHDISCHNNTYFFFF